MNSNRNQNEDNLIKVEDVNGHHLEDREMSEEMVDESEEEYGNDLSFIPEDQREVFIDKAQLSIFELHRRSVRGDIILQPHYQRKDVWTRSKKSKLIESVLCNIPIPSIYLAETKDGDWEVIDGQQRLRAFFDFIEGKYKLSQMPILSNLKNKYFNDLGTYQRKLEDYQLHIFIIKKESHPDIRFDIFERINEGATQLNAQELRNSIYRGERINLIKNLSKNKHFVQLTKGKLQDTRLKDQEAILRFLSFYLNGYKSYNGSLNSFLNYTLDNYYKYDLSHINQVLDSTMVTIYQVFKDSAFIKNGSKQHRINMSLYDIITYSFAVMNQSKILKHKDDIVLLLDNLIKQDEQFNKSLSSSTLTKRNVIYRFDKWISHLNELLEEKEANNDKKF